MKCHYCGKELEVVASSDDRQNCADIECPHCYALCVGGRWIEGEFIQEKTPHKKRHQHSFRKRKHRHE